MIEGDHYAANSALQKSVYLMFLVPNDRPIGHLRPHRENFLVAVLAHRSCVTLSGSSSALMRSDAPKIAQMAKNELETESASPDPEAFIKSIAEQGYKLETAIADLIDNSISAGADKVEVLLDTNSRPFTLFIADNGRGMDEQTLRSAMQFPSAPMDDLRGSRDLGRFGLGLKTASFSQTQHFTVLSRASDNGKFQGRTWDIKLLKEKGWVVKIESKEEIRDLRAEYDALSEALLEEFDESFKPRTIIAWRGLFKFEDYIEEHDCADILKSELTKVTKWHLSLVFHRFMQRTDAPLKIRLNNVLVKPFNPFPSKRDGVRRLGIKNRKIGNDTIKIEGFVLPAKAIDGTKHGTSPWVPQGKGLMDLEGIYMYRLDRIILYGSWLGLSSRSQRMQLGRMRVEIGNAVDHLLHLNVAKSQVEIPYDIRAGLTEYIAELKTEAEREYYNRTVRRVDAGEPKRTEPFIKTTATTRGAQMEINHSFPLVKELVDSLNTNQRTNMKAILRMVRTELNKIRRVHVDTTFTAVESEDELSQEELVKLVNKLLKGGFERDFVKTQLIRELGYEFLGLPKEVKDLLD